MTRRGKDEEMPSDLVPVIEVQRRVTGLKHQGTWSAYLGGFYKILYPAGFGALALHWAFLTRLPWRQPRTRIARGGGAFWRAAKAAFTRVSCVAMSPTGGGASSPSRVFPLQQESKALTRVRSQIRVPTISSGRVGTVCRFNGYDERCRGFLGGSRLRSELGTRATTAQATGVLLPREARSVIENPLGDALPWMTDPRAVR
jgi:hypothetical protein